jgi:hypothetical protein
MSSAISKGPGQIQKEMESNGGFWSIRKINLEAVWGMDVCMCGGVEVQVNSSNILITIMEDFFFLAI